MEKQKIYFIEKINEINLDIQSLQVEIGQLKEAQKQYSTKAEESKELIENLRIQLQINEFPAIDDRKSLLNTLRSALSLTEDKYNCLVTQNDLDEKELQGKIDQIREECAAGKQQLTSKTKLTVEIKNKLKDIKNKLEELDSSDFQLKNVGKAIEESKSNLLKLKNSFDESQKIQEIEEMKEIIARKELNLEKLDREYRVLQQNYAKEQQLESERNALLEKQREIIKIKNKHAEKFEKIFGEHIPHRNFKKSIVDVQDREEIKVKEITQKVNQLEKEIAALETTINHNKRKIDNDKKELKYKQNKIMELCDGKQFEQVLRESYKKKEKFQKDKGQYSSAKIMYEAFINKFQEEAPCCPICETDFKNKGTIVQGIIKKLKARIERIPTELKQVIKSYKFKKKLLKLIYSRGVISL